MKLKQIILLMMVCVVATGCFAISNGGKNLMQKDMARSTAKNSFLYGYIDMEKADAPLHWLILRKQVHGESLPKYIYARVENGIFFLEDAESARYEIFSFGGADWTIFQCGIITFRCRFSYSLERRSVNYGTEITKPGVHFAGAYKWEESAALGDRLIKEDEKKETFTLTPVKRHKNKVKNKLVGLLQDSQWKKRLQRN